MRWLLPIALLVACNSASSSSSSSSSAGGAAKSSQLTGDFPAGVWVGTDLVTNYDPDNFHEALNVKGFAFWADGNFNKGLPASGFADFDQAQYQREIGGNASLGGDPGTYKRDGDVWSLSYKRGHQAILKRVGDHLETEKAKLFPAKDVTGAVLDGAYTWYTDAEDPSLAEPGCKPVVLFTRAGTFDDRGGFATPCQTSGPDAPGTGTYELRDYSIVMHYRDGRTVKHLITPVVNGDLHEDNSRAFIMYRVWQRRKGAIAATPAAPAPPAASDVTSFDAVAFATPPGTSQRGGSTITFTDAAGDQLRCMTVVFAGVASTGDPKRDFAADWHDVMLNGRTADSAPAPDAARTPSGLVFTVGGSLTTEASNGTRVYRVLFVFEVGGKRVDVMMIAPTQAGLAACRVDDLLQSIRAT